MLRNPYNNPRIDKGALIIAVIVIFIGTILFSIKRCNAQVAQQDVLIFDNGTSIMQPDILLRDSLNIYFKKNSGKTVYRVPLAEVKTFDGDYKIVNDLKDPQAVMEKKHKKGLTYEVVGAGLLTLGSTMLFGVSISNVTLDNYNTLSTIQDFGYFFNLAAATALTVGIGIQLSGQGGNKHLRIVNEAVEYKP